MKRKSIAVDTSSRRACPPDLLARARGGNIATFDPNEDVVLDLVSPQPPIARRG